MTVEEFETATEQDLRKRANQLFEDASKVGEAKSRGKRLGRSRVVVDRSRIATLRKEGRSWSEICEAMVISKGTAQRAVLSLPKNLPETAPLGS